MEPVINPSWFKKTPITSSQLNRRITLQQPTYTSDGQGGHTAATWTTVPGCASVPAGIQTVPFPRKGDEDFQMLQVFASSWVIVTIRFRPSTNISDTMRVLYGTKTYEVKGVKVPDESRQLIQLLCVELEATGSLH